MSEKYSTEELVDALKANPYKIGGEGVALAIIARLLAWENLREVIRKAIAEYEGKE